MLANPNGDEDGANEGGVPDARLRSVFACCHPALPLDDRIALALRTVGGLTTAEIARALLVPETTMARRLARGARLIGDGGFSLPAPEAHELPDRLGGVLAVLYSLFTEGYAATAGDELVRRDLCEEAIRLARALVGLMPDEPEARGLLALMLLHDARREARVDAAGDLVTLEEQDRSRWNHDRIAEGIGVLTAALRHGRPGTYQIQAAIAACHAEAADAADTDWVEIALLYGRLGRLVPLPVVELNRAVAVAMADGPAAGLPLIEALDASGELAGYHLLPAARADLLRRLGRRREAAAAYRAALDLAGTEPERRFLSRRLADIGGSP